MLCQTDKFLWKIADFGLSAEGTSGRDRTTEYARGTASYRAPELVKETIRLGDARYTYNNKVDVWAFGCILYEILSQKRAFSGDEAVLNYALAKGDPTFQIAVLWKSLGEASSRILSELTLAMLQIDGPQRPAARDILHVLRSTEIWSRGLIWISKCRHYIGQNDLMNILAPQWSSKVWGLVKWSPCRYVATNWKLTGLESCGDQRATAFPSATRYLLRHPRAAIR